MSGRGFAFLGIPNHVATDMCTVETSGFPGTLEPADMAGEWLKTEEPSELARLLSLDPLYSRWFFNFGNVVVNIDGLAAINVNFSGNAKYRFAGMYTATEPGPKTKAPNAILASTNITGVIGNIDEAISVPDASYIGPSNTAIDWSMRLGWGVFSTAPATGYSMAQIVIRAKLFASGAGATAPLSYPKINIEIYESNVFKVALGQRPVTVSATDGQVLIYAFDTSVLTDPTCANVEVFLTSEPGQSVSGHQYCKVESLQFYYEDAGDVDEDSGWIDMSMDLSTHDGPTKSVHYFPTARWFDIQLVAFMVMDDHAYESPSATKTVGTSGIPAGLIQVNPPQYVQAGVFVAGEAIFLEHGVVDTETPSHRIEVEQAGGNSGSGQTYGADAFRLRGTEPITFLVTRLEGNTLMHRLGWEKGLSGAFYAAAEPDIAAIYQVFSAFWCTLDGPMSLSRALADSYSPGADKLHYLTLGLVEKL